MNKIVVMGRLTKDPEVRYTPSQKVVSSFTLAVDRDFKNPDGTRTADFIPVVVWGKAAELCGNSLAKGHRLLVEGRLQIRNFDGKDGQRHWVAEIVANNVQFIERRRTEENPANGEAKPMEKAEAPAPAEATTAPAKASYRSTASYNKQPAKAGGYKSTQSKYTPSQASYQRQNNNNNGVVSPFDEEVPF